MLKVGITGQSGFMGTHLYNYLGLKENIKRIPFKDEYFDNDKTLQEFVTQCDVIIHLAAMNRHNDPEVIYNTNIALVKKLIKAMEETNSTPHVIFYFLPQPRKRGITLTENQKRRGGNYSSNGLRRIMLFLQGS